MFFNDFISLFYPDVCAACGNKLFKHEKEICSRCYISLPKSDFHKDIGNPVAKLFHGRADIVMAASYYLFTKSGNVQRILHQLKYKGNKDVGVTLGKWYGDELKKSPGFSDAQMILPVPLHRKKLSRRGYNQSTCFADGLAESMNIEMREDLLIRKSETTTQTRKSRFDRWLNVADKFELQGEEELRNKHVILVDDVVTTGATLEACVQELKKAEGIKVSIATIAYAQQV
jgi:ComF family protein